MAILNHSQIEGLIPHAGAMVLLESVEAWDADSIRCTARSHRAPNNPLRRGRLWAMAGIEYAGQAMALHGALTSTARKQARVLGALRDVRIVVPILDDLGPQLTIGVRLLGQADAGALYAFTLHDGERLILSGTGSVFLL